MKKKQNKQSPRRAQRIDWTLFAVLLLSAAAAFVLVSRVYFLFSLSTLMTRVMLCAGAVVLLLVLISFLLIYTHKLRGAGRIAYRFFMILLSIALCFCSYTAYSSHNALSIITQGDQSVIKVSLITMKDSSITSLEQLSARKVGIQSGTDKTNADFAKEKLDADVNGVQYEEMLDYLSMYDALQEGGLDAMIITDTNIKLLKEQYPDIQNDIQVLTTYERPNDAVNTATTGKDLRSEPFVIYLGGMDEGDDPSINSKCDVNILLLVNPKINKITTISIPRDSYVPNPALHYGSDKLTHLGNNGPENSIAGIEEFTGIDIDYYAKVNFFSLIEIIDAIGGVEVDVQLDFCEQDEYRNKDEAHQICLAKGVQTLNGKEALAYSRHRKTESWGTQGREKAQSQIIAAVIKKLTTVEGASNVNKVMSIAQKYISTNIPMDSLTAFLSYQLDHLKPWTVDSITLTDGYDDYYTTVSIPGLPLSCHLLTMEDAKLINMVYNSMYKTPSMQDFSFDLNDLSFRDVSVNDSPYMIWAGDAAYLDSNTVYFGLSNPGYTQENFTQNTQQPQAPQQEQPQTDDALPPQESDANDVPSDNNDTGETIPPAEDNNGTGNDNTGIPDEGNTGESGNNGGSQPDDPTSQPSRQ